MSTKTYLDDIYKKSDPLYVVNNQTLKKAENNAKNNANTTNTSATTTQTTNTSATKPTGVDDASWQTANSKYSASNNQNKLDSTVQSDLSNFKNLASNKNIISNGTWNDINSSFVVPSEVLEADRYLAEQLQKIQIGKTSYSDQVRDMMDKIMNRDKFSYDVDTDPLFQQALASATNSGKQAMQDTIGQASALTGGYGSTYATTAGNQAYNAYIEDAYDNLPQYYQMSRDAYDKDVEEMYRQYSMLSTEDDKEYNRNITAYDATYQYRNQKYNDAYTQYRDAKSDAFAMANLELSENSQIVNNAYNMYQASSNYADSMYQREYKTWLDSVNQAWQAIQTQRGAYESDRAFDEGVRRYEQSFAEDVRRFDVGEANKLSMHNDQMSLNYAELTQRAEEHKNEMAYKYSALAQDQSQFEAKQKSDKENKTTKLKSPTSTQITGAKNAYKNGGLKGYEAFVEDLGVDVNIDELFAQVSSETNLGMYNAEIKKKDDAFWRIPGGVDKNDTVSIGDTEYRVSELPKELQETMSAAKVGDVYYFDWKTSKWKKKSNK